MLLCYKMEECYLVLMGQIISIFLLFCNLFLFISFCSIVVECYGKEQIYSILKIKWAFWWRNGLCRCTQFWVGWRTLTLNILAWNCIKLRCFWRLMDSTFNKYRWTRCNIWWRTWNTEGNIDWDEWKSPTEVVVRKWKLLPNRAN